MEQKNLESLILEAEKIPDECLKVGDKLARLGIKKRRNARIVKIILTMIGVLAFISLLEPVKKLFSFNISVIFSIMASIALIASTFLSMITEGYNHPDVLGAYSNYILHKHGVIKDIIIDDSQTAEVRKARLIDVIKYSRKNLEDRRTKWPHLFDDK